MSLDAVLDRVRAQGLALLQKHGRAVPVDTLSTISTTSLIKKCNRLCIESADASEDVKNSGMIATLIDTCEDIAGPLRNTTADGECSNRSTNLSDDGRFPLVVAIAQFLSNFAAIGFLNALHLWRQFKGSDGSFLGFQHLMVASKSVSASMIKSLQSGDTTSPLSHKKHNMESRKAIAATVACIHNCYVKLSDAVEGGTSEAHGVRQELVDFLACKAACSQILLSIDRLDASLATKTLSGDGLGWMHGVVEQRTDAEADAEVEDPVVEWLHLFVHRIVVTGAAHAFFTTVGKKKPHSISSSSTQPNEVEAVEEAEWFSILTHEQVILCQILFDVYSEFVAPQPAVSASSASRRTRHCFDKYVLSPLVERSAQRSEQNESEPVSVNKLLCESTFFASHAALMRAIAGDIIPSYVGRMQQHPELFGGLSAKATALQAMSANAAAWLMVTKYCIDLLAYGAVAIPEQLYTEEIGGGEAIMLRLAASNCRLRERILGISATVSGANPEELQLDAENRVALSALNHLLVLLSPAPKAQQSTPAGDVASNPVVESLDRKISTYDEIEAAALSGREGNAPAEVAPPVAAAAASSSPPPSSMDSNSSAIVVLANEVIKSIVKCIGNLVYRCTAAQDLFRLCDTMPLILSKCNTNFNNPLVREYCLLCIRNACEGNEANQAVIQSMKGQQPPQKVES